MVPSAVPYQSWAWDSRDINPSPWIPSSRSTSSAILAPAWNEPLGRPVPDPMPRKRSRPRNRPRPCWIASWNISPRSKRRHGRNWWSGFADILQWMSGRFEVSGVFYVFFRLVCWWHVGFYVVLINFPPTFRGANRGELAKVRNDWGPPGSSALSHGRKAGDASKLFTRST